MSSEDSSSRVFLLGRSRSEWLSCSGPCMLTFSVPLFIPGISLTVIAAGHDDIVGDHAFFALGLAILVMSTLLFIAGLALCIFKNVQIPPSVGVTGSTATLRNDVRIYMGSRLGDASVFRANGSANNNKADSDQHNVAENGFSTAAMTVNNRNYKAHMLNYSSTNGIYVKNPKTATSKGDKLHKTQMESKSEPITTLQLHHKNSLIFKPSPSPESHKIPVIYIDNDMTRDIRRFDYATQSPDEMQPADHDTANVPVTEPKHANVTEKPKIVYTCESS